MTAFNRHAFTNATPDAFAGHRPVPQPQRGQIDTLRALACLALVSFHVVGYTPQSGLGLPYDHQLHRINAVLVDLRMPLFSFISGYVFVVLLPQGSGFWAWDRIIAKARRLLLPMITVATVFWLMRAAMGVAQQDLWTIYVLPYAHFWYLQATMLIMISFIGLVWLTGGRGSQAAMILMIAGFAAWLYMPRAGLDIFAAKQAVRLSGFFAAGYLVAQAGPWVQRVLRKGAQRRLGALMLMLALLCGALTAQGIWVPDGTARVCLAILVGLGGSIALCLIQPYHVLLASLGRYSYAIYLFHIFFTAGTRDVAGHFVPDLPVALIWTLSVLAGLIGPIYVQRILLRHWACALFGLGLRRKPALIQARPKPAPATAPIAADRAVLSADTNPLV